MDDAAETSALGVVMLRLVSAASAPDDQRHRNDQRAVVLDSRPERSANAEVLTNSLQKCWDIHGVLLFI
jgi:hypothetical protein